MSVSQLHAQFCYTENTSSLIHAKNMMLIAREYVCHGANGQEIRHACYNLLGIAPVMAEVGAEYVRHCAFWYGIRQA